MLSIRKHTFIQHSREKENKILHSADDDDDDNDDDNTDYYQERENKNERESEGSDSSTITPPASSDLECAKIKIPSKNFLSFLQTIYLMYSNSKNGVHQTPSHSSTAGMPAYRRIIVSRLILALSRQMFKTITLTQQHNCYTEDTEASRQAARKLPTKNKNNNNPMHSQTYNKNKSNERQTTTSLIHNVSCYSLVSSAVSLIAILLRSVDFTYATTTLRRRRRGALGHTSWDSSNDAVHHPFPSIFTDQH